MPSSTRSTCAASPTRTATEWGTSPGLRSRLPWIRALGADAVWVNPWYPSPMVDGGYDVADYRAIDPRFGTLDDVRGLLDDAHALGLRVLADIVPNHTSADHPWFREALAAEPGSTARARYLFRDGRGPGGDEPPNNWLSVFGGRAWTRAPRTGDRPAQWYCHLFDPLQPDLDWSNPEVRAEFAAILRFWFDIGIDGFRIDVAQGMVKADGLPDVPDGVGPWVGGMSHPYWGQDGVHDILRAWRRIADAYPDHRVLIGEVGPTEDDRHARMARFVRPDELHGVFNFDLMAAAWDAEALRAAIERTDGGARGPGGAGDLGARQPRHATAGHPVRAGGHVRADARGAGALPRRRTRPRRRDGRGRRRCCCSRCPAPRSSMPARSWVCRTSTTCRTRSSTTPSGAAPGSPSVAATVVGSHCRGPATRRRSGSRRRACGPGCRSPRRGRRSRPRRRSGIRRRRWRSYRAAMALRHGHPGLAGGAFRWLPAPAGVLAFERDAGFRCIVNTSDGPMPLPTGSAVLLRSDAGAAPCAPLPANAAVWLGPPAGRGSPIEVIRSSVRSPNGAVAPRTVPFGSGSPAEPGMAWRDACSRGADRRSA